MRRNECDFLKVERVWAVIPGSLYGMPNRSHCHGLSLESTISVATLAMCRG